MRNHERLASLALLTSVAVDETIGLNLVVLKMRVGIEDAQRCAEDAHAHVASATAALSRSGVLLRELAAEKVDVTAVSERNVEE
jgi:hypothetical protein